MVRALKAVGRGIKRVGKAVGHYTMNVLIGVDQLGNTILAGAPDETISARAGRNAKKKGWRVLAKALNKIDPGHVEDAILSERMGKQQADAYADVYDEEDYGFTLTVEAIKEDPNGTK